MAKQMTKENIEVKPKFKARYEQLTDFDVFLDISMKFLRRAVRVNTLKTTIPKVRASLEKKGWILKQVPWCKEGFWIEHKGGRRDIGNTPEHMLGYIYIQEPASMIPPIVLDPKPGELVLDMCASPGSKAGQIGQYMKNEGVLIANDYKGDRMKPLGINMQRIGLSNVILTMTQGQNYPAMQFDKIQLDAPCSGTGTIRKSLKTLKIWNENMVRRIAAQQKQLIKRAFTMLKPGGVMTYSTCTMEPEENEGIITYLLEEFPDAKIEPIKLEIKRSEPVLEFNGEKFNPEVRKCLRIWPQDNDTEGFFVCRIRKGC